MKELDLNEFLLNYPGMSIKLSQGKETILKGKFCFIAKAVNSKKIEDCYDLLISIPGKFPCELPKVTEIGNKIPRDGNYHINPDDTLCLGSPFRLLKIINSNPTIVGFAENCLVPYLYAVSMKMKYNYEFIFGELEHGMIGVIDDCIKLFNLQTREQVLETIKLIRMKKRLANKEKCPCGCGNRLGKCKFNRIVSEYRELIPKSWFKK